MPVNPFILQEDDPRRPVAAAQPVAAVAAGASTARPPPAALAPPRDPRAAVAAGWRPYGVAALELPPSVGDGGSARTGGRMVCTLAMQALLADVAGASGAQGGDGRGGDAGETEPVPDEGVPERLLVRIRVLVCSALFTSLALVVCRVGRVEPHSVHVWACELLFVFKEPICIVRVCLCARASVRVSVCLVHRHLSGSDSGGRPGIRGLRGRRRLRPARRRLQARQR